MSWKDYEFMMWDQKHAADELARMSNLQRQKLQERDPNGLDLKTPGSKADAEKAPLSQGLLQYFPRALIQVAKTSEVGSRKYSWKGWETVPNGINRYGDALCRHLVAESIEGEFDRDTGLLHSAQVAWNALARLELILREKEKCHT